LHAGREITPSGRPSTASAACSKALRRFCEVAASLARVIPVGLLLSGDGRRTRAGATYATEDAARAFDLIPPVAVAPTLERAAGVEPLQAVPASRETRRLFERHRERVFAFCLSRLRSREDAEDAVQTTFLYAFRALDRGIHPDVEIAWLLAIAKNVCRARWDETRRRRLEAPSDPHVLGERFAAEGRDALDLSPLRSALAALPPGQRQAILLREWKGLSYREIASELGVTQAAVETMIFRARGQLADALEAAGVAVGRRRLARANAAILAALNGLKSVLSGGAGALKLAALLGAAAAAVVAGSGTAVRSAPPMQATPHAHLRAIAPPTSAVDRVAAGAPRTAARTVLVAGSHETARRPRPAGRGSSADASTRKKAAPPGGSPGPGQPPPSAGGVVSAASKLVASTVTTASAVVQTDVKAVTDLSGTATQPVETTTDTVASTLGPVLDPAGS